MLNLLICSAAVYLVWLLLDILFHGVLLTKDYERTQDIWLQRKDQKRFVSFLAIAIYAILFTCVFWFFVADKTVEGGLGFGVLWGLAVGVFFAYGDYYAFHPVPHSMVFLFFLGCLMDGITGGLVLGYLNGVLP